MLGASTVARFFTDDSLSEEVGSDRSLLVLCSAFRGNSDAFTNLTVKKIPNHIRSRCEWGHDDYSLNVANLPNSSSRRWRGAGNFTRQAVRYSRSRDSREFFRPCVRAKIRRGRRDPLPRNDCDAIVDPRALQVAPGDHRDAGVFRPQDRPAVKALRVATASIPGVHWRSRPP